MASTRDSACMARAPRHLGAMLAATMLAFSISGGAVADALETIAISADLKARALPAIDAWIKARDGKRP